MPRAWGASFLLARVGLGETPWAAAPETDSTCWEGVSADQEQCQDREWSEQKKC